MGVWTMKCIEYDYRFQVELCETYPNWTPPENSEPKGKGKRKKKIKEEDVKVEVKEEDQIFEAARQMQLQGRVNEQSNRTGINRSYGGSGVRGGQG